MSESIYQPPSSDSLPAGPHTLAVSQQSWKQKLFSFQGRFSRSQFWGYGFGFSYLASFLMIGPMIPMFVALAAAESGESTNLNIPLLVICGIAMLAIAVVSSWIYLAGIVKRLHDRNKSGHWAWVLLIPYIGAFWMLIECGCLEGMRGQPNRYGSDPLSS